MANETETETGLPLGRADAALRTALLTLPALGGWEIPLGRPLLDEVERRAAIEARRLPAFADASDEEYASHLVGGACECRSTQTESAVEARSPWAYVHTVMTRAAAAVAAGRFPAVQISEERIVVPARALDELAERAVSTGRLVDAAECAGVRE